jgi:N-acetylglutamate synthase
VAGLGPWCVGVRVVVRRVVAGETGPTGGPRLTDVLGVLEAWGERTVSVRAEDGAVVVIDRADIVAGKPVPPRPSVRLRVPVADAELRAMDSWPAIEVEGLGAWVLRASAGFSARANSALVLGDPGPPWQEALDRLTAFYADRGLPPWVQAMVGSAELARLEEEGWVTARPGEADTCFQLAGVASALRGVRRLLPADTPGVTHSDHASPAWLADDERALQHRDAAVAVLEGPAAVRFVSVTAPDGTVVAKGRAALSERTDVWAGISDVWVSPEERRRGLGAVVLDRLLGWGAEEGATTAYLQVRLDNRGALALYERLGFVAHHRYRYLRFSGR